jgi:DNA-binding NarL/FixJ family response regulator
MTSSNVTAFESTGRANEAAHTSYLRPAALHGAAARTRGGTPRELGKVRAAEGPLQDSPRIVIAVHQAAARFGIRLTLERAGFVIVAESVTADDAAALATASRPDACLIDVGLPGGGIAAARTISARAPQTALVMLSATLTEDDLLAAVSAGASGYLPATIDPERLPVVLRAVLTGETAIPRAMGHRLLEEIRWRRNGASPRDLLGCEISLTPRETQILQLTGDDMSTRDIAAWLGISEITVRRHVSAALRKLGAPDRQAAVRAFHQLRSRRREDVQTSMVRGG